MSSTVLRVARLAQYLDQLFEEEVSAFCLAAEADAQITHSPRLYQFDDVEAFTICGLQCRSRHDTNSGSGRDKPRNGVIPRNLHADV